MLIFFFLKRAFDKSILPSELSTSIYSNVWSQ